jgi:hypothetical protein
MKKRALVLMAACAVLFAAGQVFAAPLPNDWVGTWVFTYSGNVTDNVTFTDVCVKPDCPQGNYWEYIAHGKKSDNTTVQIRKIQFGPTQNFYYELDDAAIVVCGQSCPSATIPDANYVSICNSFTVTAVTAPITLVSGKKNGSPDNCSDDNCTLQIIPSKISKLLAFAQPIKPFIIIGSGDPAFVRGDKAAFDSDKIEHLISLKITKKILLTIAFINPFALEAGNIEVSVGNCVATITVK